MVRGTKAQCNYVADNEDKGGGGVEDPTPWVANTKRDTKNGKKRPIKVFNK